MPTLMGASLSKASSSWSKQVAAGSSRQAQLDLLALRLLKRSLGQANSVALSENPVGCGIDVRLCDGDSDIVEVGQNGSCGFSVVMPHSPSAASGPSTAQNRGMCHHYTWDGKHCVTAGLGLEHANRCAGCLCR